MKRVAAALWQWKWHVDCRVIHSFIHSFIPQAQGTHLHLTSFLLKFSNPKITCSPIKQWNLEPYQCLRWSYKFHTASYWFRIWFFDWPNTQFSNSVAVELSWLNLNKGIQICRSLLQSHTQPDNSVTGWAFVPGTAFSIQSKRHTSFVTTYWIHCQTPQYGPWLVTTETSVLWHWVSNR